MFLAGVRLYAGIILIEIDDIKTTSYVTALGCDYYL